MRQYRDAKVAYPDALLLFRLGDFYEMFNDDAVVAASDLGLTLTCRNRGSAEEVPMAGVPVHTVHNYVARLVARGHKVAICEQMGDPSKIKGLVPRKVVRVLTPGLLTDDGQLDARRNNFLVAVDDTDGDRYGIALYDLSTGELAAGTVEGKALLTAELARAEPSELLLPEGLEDMRAAVRDVAPRAAVRRDDALADGDLPRLLDEGVAAPLHRDATSDHPLVAVRAAARVLRFARHYLPDAVLPVRRVAVHQTDERMHVDETAQAHLELVRGSGGDRKGSLLDAVDATVTAPGARLLRRRLLSPLVEVAAIRRRLDAVELFVRHPRARAELRAALANVGDLERLAVRAGLCEASPRDLGGLRASLEAAPRAVEAVAAAALAETDAAELRGALELDVDTGADLAELLRRAVVDDPPAMARDGGMIREGWDAELDELRAMRQNGAELMARLESRLREETQIGSLKVRYTRAFGWYIEISRAKVDRVPAPWRRRQQLSHAERYVTDELEEMADKLLHAEERYAEREAKLYDELVARAGAEAERVHRLAAAVARWDVASALAEIAQRHDFVRPEVDEGEALDLEDARHAVVERFVPAGRFVPNDTRLDLGGERLWLVTGPNMAGKSTLMRQVALVTILAQMGSFVPARRARVGVVDRVLSRVGASDDLARGESTFMVEMRETAAILRNATRRSLVILDEIGRGTSTYDGLAIAWAVAEHLHERVRCRAMFATHYHQLTALAEQHAGVANYSVSAREHQGDLVFLHRLTRGAVSRSFGIAVARLAGLPEAVLSRARALLVAFEQAPGGSLEPQLDLFQRPAEPPGPRDEETAVIEQLRALDPNRLTPLEALALLAELKRRVE
jgi:DNA mismatch repair protein MutS